MEFEDEQNAVPGCVPEFGAIFMSNRATKNECFRRKLLGLPSSQAQFVRQVKAGMLLFLFEFERRELHGVFQASSNGAMNIVPNAYCSSGKQFPAQVKFTPLWHCGPLSEDEFGDAIQENYYAAKKFNFGLSEDQVYKLLYLFSLRKLKPQKHLSDTIAFTGDSNIPPAESSVFNELKPSSAIHYSMEPQVKTFPGSTSIRLAVPYDPDAPGIDTRHSSSHEFIAPGIDTRRSSSYNLVGPGIDTRHSSSHNLVGLSSHDLVSPGIDTKHSSSHDLVGLGIDTRSSSSQDFVGHTRRSSSRDFVAAGIDTRFSSSYDFIAAGINTRRPSSHDFIAPGIDTRSSPSLDFSSPGIDAGHSSSHDFVAPGVDSRCPSAHDFVARGIDTIHLSPHEFVAPYDSGFGCCVPVFSSYYSEPSRRARVPILEATYSENMASDSGYIDRISEAPIHALSPSHIPHFVLDYKYHEASPEKHDYEMLQCGISEACVANVPICSESQSQLQNCLCSVKIKSPDLQVNSSSKPDIHKTSGSLYSEIKRESVFSRLGVASEARVEDNDTLLGDNEDNEDTSINEVMSMLYQSRHEWLKTRKRQLIEDDASNFLKKRQTAFNSQSSKNDFQKISKEVKMSDIQHSKESSEQFVEKISFVNFRRRSEVRKTHKTDSETASHSASADISSGLRKRRKLIRPDFSKKGLSDVKSINSDTPGVLLPDVLSQKSHADKKTIEAELDLDCKAVEMGEAAPPGYIDEDGKELTQNVGIRRMPSSVSCEDTSNITEQGLIIKNSALLPDVLGQISHADKNTIEAELDSDCKAVEIGEAVPPGYIDEDGKELTQNVGIQGMPSWVSCEDTSNITERGLIIKNSVLDGSSPDLCNVNHCVGQESSPETCKRDANGITSGETECCRGDEREMYPNLDVDCKIVIDTVTASSDQNPAIDTVTDSSDQNPKSGMMLDELVLDGCKDCKMDVQQIVESENVLSRSCEISAGNCKRVSN